MNTTITDHNTPGTRFAASAVSTFRSWGQVGARRAVPAVYLPSVNGDAFAKHSAKQCAGMALIDTTGWPLAPQERLSG